MLDADPGPLVEVQGGAGDTHRNGRSVMILTFSNGARIVYKPRSLAVEAHFQQLLGWLNEHGAEPILSPSQSERPGGSWLVRIRDRLPL